MLIPSERGVKLILMTIVTARDTVCNDSVYL